ncbi:Protein APEM9 [Glycine soja]
MSRNEGSSLQQAIGASAEAETMDTDAAAAIWKEIEASESYLVCSMYEEAAQLASSVLERLRHSHHDIDRDDMLESSAMVLLQAFNQLPSKTPHILNQLTLYFVSPKAIPSRLLLTGSACFQIAQGSALSVQQFLHEFLNGWTLEHSQYSAVITEAASRDQSRRFILLPIVEYLQVVELYAVTLLATLQKNVDLAISWVENASLPEENRQELLRRLHSMHSPKSTILSQSSFLQSPTNSNEAYPLKEQNVSEGLPKALKSNEKYRSKEAVTKLSERIEACFWCFRGINLKIGTSKFVITSGKIMLGCLILFIYYVFRKKQATLKRIVRRQAMAVKRALVDLWQLAFSYQVNPLAAVQPLSATTRQGQ